MGGSALKSETEHNLRILKFTGYMGQIVTQTNAPSARNPQAGTQTEN